MRILRDDVLAFLYWAGIVVGWILSLVLAIWVGYMLGG
jgi:hypothetical protein